MYNITIKRKEYKKMTEFETIKTALERLGHDINITKFTFINEVWIMDLTSDVTFEFRNGQLKDIDNGKED